jgi:hypothetical protein
MPEKNWHWSRAVFLNELMARDPNSRLSERQAADLWFLVWRYRRQITDVDVVDKANEIVNGALSFDF